MKDFKFDGNERGEITDLFSEYWLGDHDEDYLLDRIETIIRSRADADGWVKVEDGLPEDGQDCFFYYGSKYPIIGTYKKASKVFMCMEGNELWSIKEDGITHWSPCPQPPKQ